MKNNLIMGLYWRMPVALQELTLSIYCHKIDKIYYGKEYEEYKQSLTGWINWSTSHINDYKNERLQHVIQLAAKYVPYYRNSFKKCEWEKVHSESDLYLLPLLEKQSIRQSGTNFIVDMQNIRSLWKEKTSGTTGTSLKIYWPMSMVPKWWAIYEVMCRNVAGVSQEMPRSMMGGRPIIRGNTSKPPYWRYNKKWKQLYLSSYHVSNKTAEAYITAIKRYGSLWMTGYGSTIAALSESALEENLSPLQLRAVIVSGDTLLSGMRSSIEKYFQCKCFDHYGQAEGVAMAMECNHGRMHVIPTIGIIEIVRPDGSACNPGETGEIVATTLLNDAMPLIRYRTGDYAAWAEEQICPCGNKNRIINNLEGRVDDYLLTEDGRKVGRLSTAMKRSPTIHSAQIVQHKPGHAYLLIRPGYGYKSSHAAAIRDDIIERIGKFEIEIVEVKEIPKTLQGKTRLVVRLDERPLMVKTYEHLFKNK